jgi:carbamoyltransferase
MARYAHQLTGEKQLCLSGGVALNCVANGRLLREGPFEEIWIQPAAGDSGSALGAAMDAYYSYFGNSRLDPTDEQGCEQGGSYWGPEFSEQEIASFLETHGYKHRQLNPSERASRIAQYLDSGKVVGHFSGRTEFGPRSLGSRSILGDARNEETQTTLNLRIKYRESFRPFAPTVLAERVSDYFELDRESPYMLIVAKVKKERQKPFERGTSSDLLAVVRRPRSDIPAVTHVDYSARIQTIKRSDHRHYYDVVKAFEKLTGCGVIVNTSFNVRGEPIVCTPYDAYRCFMRTEMDVLVLGNYLLLKEEQSPYTDEKGGVEEEAVSSRPNNDHNQVPIRKALAKIYSRDFLPLSTRLVNRGVVRPSSSFKSVPSTWKDHEKKTPQEIFCIPHELDAPKASHSEMAAAITGFWKRGVATESLEPILAKLLELGERFPEPNTDREKVSDSVYVMY